MKKAHIVIVRGLFEDVSWINSLKYSFTLYSFSNEIPNLGGEFYPFYKWIYDNYDNLPDYLILIHAHRKSWHCVENIDYIVNNLLFHYKFENINIFPPFYYPEIGHKTEDWTLVTTKEVDIDKKDQLHLNVDIDFYSTFFEYKFVHFLETFGIEKFPMSQVFGKRSGQCYVSKGLILNKSKDFWKKLLDEYYYIPESLGNDRPDVIEFFSKVEKRGLNYLCALFFEIINHYIFTGFKDYREVFNLNSNM